MDKTQSPLNIKSRTIYCRDNLDILAGINSGCIDLIYLDPPFNKKKVFTAPIGSSAEGAEFSDIFREEDVKTEWVKSIEFENPELYEYLRGVRGYSSSYNYCYLVYMAIRLLECHRILKITGSIYLHCDPTMSHYLKVLLDCIFGERNFRNELIWCYKENEAATKHFPKKHDVILYCSKSNEYTFNIQRSAPTAAQLSRYNHIIGKERYANMKGKMRKLEGGAKVRDWWAMPIVQHKERTGYPTQKPLALLKRIISASSNAGDMVLDPFCGCATTCVAAESLQRQWVGVDISHKAYEPVNKRLAKEVPSGLLDEKPTFSTKPPQRTTAVDAEQSGYIYIISNPIFVNRYKVGIAKDVQRRLNSYQTSDPDRGYRVEYQLRTPLYREIEKSVHENFANQHEWVNGSLDEIKHHIEKMDAGKLAK